MFSYGELRDAAHTLLSTLRDVADRRDAGGLAQRLTAAATRLRNDSLTVVVCGEFKRGKSSLLNALLDETEALFPVDARVATSAVTIVSHAPVEHVAVELVGADGTRETREIKRADIASYVTEAARPDAVDVVAVRIAIPHPLLASGLVLVDTPGVGGVFSAHTAATKAFLPSADAIVFVVDFGQPILRSEIEFLREAAAAARTVGDDDALLFVITKADLVSGDHRAELLENARAKIGAATGRDPSTVTVIPVSSDAKADYLDGGTPDDLVRSNFPRLEGQLWATVTRRRARMYLGAALTELETAARALLRPLDGESAALTVRTAAQLAELEAESATRRADMERLQARSAGWRTGLRHEMDALGRHLQREADRQLVDVWHRCNAEYVPAAVRADDLAVLSTRLQADLGLIAGTLGELARRRSADVLREFVQRNGLELPNPRIDALPAPDVLALTMPDRETPQHRYWEGVRSFSEGSEAAERVGAVVGLVAGLLFPGIGSWVGGVLGSALGTVVGAATGLFSSRSSLRTGTDAEREDRATALRAQLAAGRAQHRQDLAANIDELVDDLGRRLSADLDDRIAREIGSADDSLRRLASTRERAAQDAGRRRAEIDDERVPLLRMLQQVDDLAARAQRLGDR